MTEDNIVPFRPRPSPDRNAGGIGRLQPHVGSRDNRRAPVPPTEIIVKKQRLSPEVEAAFDAPQSPDNIRLRHRTFLRSLAHLEAAARQTALWNETLQIDRRLASGYRFMLASEGIPRNQPELCFQLMSRLEIALATLAQEFGAASIYNLGGNLVYLGHPTKTEWVRKQDDDASDSLCINNESTVEDIVAVVRPLLKPETEYRHEFYDMSYRNRQR